MATFLRMPEVLTGATEATIAAWLVGPGDTVAVGDTIAEVETDKALVDLPSPEAGVIGRLLVQSGSPVAVGTPVATLLADGEEADAEPRAAADGPAVVDDAASAPEAAAIAAETPAETPRTRLFASPLVRRLADEQGVDLATVPGSGPNGRVTRRDFERAMAAGVVAPSNAAPVAQPGASAPAARPARAEVTASGTLRPHSSMRRTIARRLTEAKATVPHFYLKVDCRVDALLELRRRVNEVAPRKVTVNDLVVKAVGHAFVRVPEANVAWSEEGTVVHDTVDVAVAVSTGDGLLTPVVRDVPGQRVSDVSAEIADLVERSRAGRLKQHELEGGSFTVSNLGMFGTQEFSAIINPPQAGILAVGAASERPVVVDGALAVATVMTATLSADHRVLDGELAARWLAAFVEAIENPLTLLV